MFRSSAVHYVYGGRPSHLQKTGKRLGWLLALAITIIGVTGYVRSVPISSVNAQQLVPQLSLPESPKLSPFESPTAFSTGSLEQAITDWLKAHPDKNWSVAIGDLASGEQYSTDTKQYRPASLYKLLLLPELFEKYNLKDFDNVNVGGQTLGQCVEKMLVESDNPCGEAIANELLGWFAIDNTLQKHGYDKLRVNDPSGMTIEAGQFSEFLVDFYHGKLVTRAERDYVFGLLERQAFRAGIPTGCQSCSRTMNKTGDNKVRHDSAIVEQDGRLYSLVILSDGGNYTDIADLTKVITSDLNRYSAWR